VPGINTRIFNGKKGFSAYDVKKADEVKFDIKTSTLETTYVLGDTGAWTGMIEIRMHRPSAGGRMSPNLCG
jgi:hypothetical protein